MLLTSIRRAPFIDLPEGNCDFLKEITLFRYSPLLILAKSQKVKYNIVIYEEENYAKFSRCYRKFYRRRIVYR